jgi:hypothetical protein
MGVKNEDYADEHSVFGNLELVEAMSRGAYDTELGILIRMGDKLSRLFTSLRRDLSVGDESIRDTLLDVVNYAVLFYAKRLDRSLSLPIATSEPAEADNWPYSPASHVTVSEQLWAEQVPVSPGEVYQKDAEGQLLLPWAPGHKGPFQIDGLPYENRICYILGPFTNGDTASDARRSLNMDAAIEAAIAVSEKGWLPHIPHCATGPIDSCDWMKYEDFMELGLAVLGICSCGFRVEGESVGADREAVALRKRGRPVWTSIGEVPDLVPVHAPMDGL